jgi:hypothetical protein
LPEAAVEAKAIHSRTKQSRAEQRRGRCRGSGTGGLQLVPPAMVAAEAAGVGGKNGNRDDDVLEQMMEAVELVLQSIGEDVQREGLRKTPLRVASAFHGALAGNKSPKDIEHIRTETIMTICYCLLSEFPFLKKKRKYRAIEEHIRVYSNGYVMGG